MADVATLGLVIDSRSAAKAGTDLDRFTSAAKKAEVGAAGLTDGANKSRDELGRFVSAAKKAEVGAGTLAGNTNAARDALGRFVAAGTSAETALTKLGQSTTGVSSGLAKATVAVDRFIVKNQEAAKTIDDAWRKAAVGQGRYADALRASDKMTDQHAKRVNSVAESLAFEMAQSQRTGRQQAVHNALRQAGVNAASQEGTALALLAGRHHDLTGKLTRTTSVSQTMVSALSSNASQMGTAGAALAALGPVGLAIAVVLGTLTLGFTLAGRAAMGLAERAGALKDLGESAGLSTNALQAFNKIGVDVGLTSEKIATSLERMAFNLAEARNRSGALYDAVRKVDGGLADELVTAGNTASALEILAKASDRAKDATAKLELSRAAFGRAPGMGRFLTEISSLGGISAAIAALNPLDRLAKEAIDSWDKLGDRIKYNVTTAKNNIVAAFAGPVLEILRDLSERFLVFSRTVRDWKSPAELKELLTDWSEKAVGAFTRLDALAVGVSTRITAIISGIAAVKEWMEWASNLGQSQVVDVKREGSAIAEFIFTPKTIADIKAKWAALWSGAEPLKVPVAPAVSAAPGLPASKFLPTGGSPIQIPPEATQNAAGLTAQLARLNEQWSEAVRMSQFHANMAKTALNPKDAAIATEAMERSSAAAAKYKKELTELEPAIGKIKPPEVDPDDRVGAAAKKAESATAKYNAMKEKIEQLGAAATPMERLNLEMAKFASLRELGAIKDPSTQTRAIAEITQATNESILALKTQAGVVSESELIAVGRGRVERRIADGIIKGEQEIATARRISAKEAKEAFEAAQVRASSLPQLTRFALDAANGMKQLDTFGVSALGNLENALVSAGDQTKTLSEKFHVMANAIIQDLLRMLIRSQITGPLAGMLSSGFSGLFGGTLQGPGINGVPIGHAGGIVGSLTRGRYIHPAYFENPIPKFHSGGMIGTDERLVLAKNDEGIFTPAQMKALGGGRGGGVNITYSPIYNIAQGADPRAIAELKQAQASDRAQFHANVVKSVRDAQSRRAL